MEDSINYLANEYMFLSLLKKDDSLFNSTDEYDDINLCVYSIDRTGKYPFLKYLLVNSGYNTFTLPKIQSFNSFNADSLISYSNVFLSGLLGVETFEEFNNNIIFNGYYEFENKLYLFYDISNSSLNINQTYLNDLKLCLIDEITNTANICNVPIDNDTTNFFILNSDINYLYDINGTPYEIPIVGYVGKYNQQKLNFTLTFGETSKDKTSIMGPFYYFSNFNRSVRVGGWSHNFKPEYKLNNILTDNEYGRYIKGGIVRFALFIGKTKYIENFPNDKHDESDIKNERLLDEDLNNKYEMFTIRISDHDGLWTKEYESVYLGNIELDDGNYLEDTPMIVLKDYNQQVPLTYHYIDKSSLGNKYDPKSNNYSIL